ncbi:MAG: phosphatidylserine/phosphatidylglycerophosphate/cardiolipin synthase family protein [Paraprevotella sp.]|nr:phosphatidylserine/phosphatidylglycerophosphate/cardiolipin synthase family protein [Paraprevotella sp.]
MARVEMRGMTKWCVVLCFWWIAGLTAVWSQTSVSDSLTVEDRTAEGVVFTPHNHVTLLPSGKEKFDDMFKAIAQAKQYVYLEYFNFRNDSIGRALFRLLTIKSREGIKVRVIYDDFGNTSNDRPLRKRYLRHLQSDRIAVEVFDPIVFPWLNHAFHRDHRKIVVIDDKIVYTGGMNVADYYIHGRPEFGEWRDMHMRLEGDAVKIYRDIFCRMWERCTDNKIDSLEYLPDSLTLRATFQGLKEDSVRDSLGVLLGVADREPHTSPKVIRKAYIDAIDRARHQIQIVNPYFTLVPSVRKALYRALKRGVKLEIMLSTKCDVPVTPDVSAYNAKRLMKRGADIYYYEKGFHHSKVMMVDSSFCTVGSANLNSRSLKYDYEVNAFIMDPVTTHELQSIFEKDKGSSTLLTPQNWKKRRSFGRRFMGWFYHLLIPLI